MARQGQRFSDLGQLRALREKLTRDAQIEHQSRQQRAAEARRAQQAATEFAQAVRGTIPLDGSGRRTPPPPASNLPPRSQRPSPVTDATVASRKSGLTDDAPDLSSTDETSYRRVGVGPDVARKLRRGYWPIEDELDLHGLTADAAHRATEDFLGDARARGLRCVRVIHGKGLGSADGAPVLKGKVRTWLRHRDAVTAFCEARPAQGGSGALLVLLRA